MAPAPDSTAAGEPWVTTVAASTQRGTAYAAGDARSMRRLRWPATIASIEGAITQPLVDSGDLTDNVVAAFPLRACAPIAPIDGIALILRGDCDFSVKITNAVNAGASAASSCIRSPAIPR